MLPILILPDTRNTASSDSVAVSSDAANLPRPGAIRCGVASSETLLVWREWCGVARAERIRTLSKEPYRHAAWARNDRSDFASLQDCERLFRTFARRWHDSIKRTHRREIWTLISDTGALALPVVPTKRLHPDACAWILCSMYWWGVSHVRHLPAKRLHPATGIVRWRNELSAGAPNADQSSRVAHLLYVTLLLTQQRFRTVSVRMHERGAYLLDPRILRFVFDFEVATKNLTARVTFTSRQSLEFNDLMRGVAAAAAPKT